MTSRKELGNRSNYNSFVIATILKYNATNSWFIREWTKDERHSSLPAGPLCSDLWRGFGGV